MLTITDFVTGARAQWVPSRAQIEAWEASERSQRVFVGKPRRAYISTAFDVEDVLQTVAADTAGHRIRTGVMLDVEAKVTERMWQMADFLDQMGVNCRASSFGIDLAGGSQIVGLTAGGKRSAASTGFQRMRYSEFSYFSDPQAMISTSASVGIEGHEVIETTVDISAANGIQARVFWRDPTNGYEKLFIPFEWLAAYKTDPARITDEQWLMAQGEGFTDRSAAAYWLAELLPAKAGGNLVMLMHEFPQKQEHMFSSGAGRVVEITPPLAEVDGHLEVTGMRGDAWNVEIYGELGAPIVHSGQVVVTVDTAYGVKKTNSIVLATDMETRRPLACFWSNEILHDDLARVAADVTRFFSPPLKSAKRDRCTLVVEADGIGHGTCVELMTLGVPHHRFYQGKDDNAERCITQAKRRVEAGMKGAPSIMLEECDELHRDERKHFKGRKDVLMMFGIANVWIDSHAFTPAPDPEARKDKANRMHFEDSLREHEQQQRLKAPRWGT